MFLLKHFNGCVQPKVDIQCSNPLHVSSPIGKDGYTKPKVISVSFLCEWHCLDYVNGLELPIGIRVSKGLRRKSMRDCNLSDLVTRDCL